MSRPISTAGHSGDDGFGGHYRTSYASSQPTFVEEDPYYESNANTPYPQIHSPYYPPQLPVIDSGVPLAWDIGGEGHPGDALSARGSPYTQYPSTPAPYDPGIQPDGALGLIDSFQHDSEQYGHYTRETYPPVPRSRSPTPNPDGEYYPIDGKDISGYVDKHEEFDMGVRHFPESERLEDPPDTKHFGPAPKGRVARRHKTKKQVVLTEGNLVTDIDVPTQLVLPRKGDPEMMQTRYFPFFIYTDL